jgi:uncharacterized protein YdcH (DUF465 family)
MENMAQDEIKAHLMATDTHFRELAEKHSDYDHKLQALEAKTALTQDEQIEEIRLKKLKLRLKDEMAAIISRRRAQQVA